MISLARRLSLMTALCGLLSGCAQTGPPLPPSLELPLPPSDLHASRKGNQVTLTWSLPVRTTDRRTIRSLGPTHICRSRESEMKECGTPVGELPALQSAHPSGATPSQSVMFTDTLPPFVQEQNSTGDITYAVEVVNRDRRGAGLSNRATVPALPTLPPPADFRAELTGSGVAFTWTDPVVATSLPGVQHRYRIYRRDESTGRDTIAIESGADEAGAAHAQDSSFEWEKTYFYRITFLSTQSRPGAEVQVEGDDSPAVRIAAHDTFPPAAPTGLQAVYSGEGQKPFVDVIWAPATDADLAGYNIYRREASGAASRLNSDVVKSPSYRDHAVASGKTYFYSVSAVDVRGNESARSEEASEAAP